MWTLMQWCVGYGGGCSKQDKNRLNRLIKRAVSVSGCPLDSIEVVGERRVLAKLSAIMNNTSHPLRQTYAAPSVRDSYTHCGIYNMDLNLNLNFNVNLNM